MQSPSDLPRFPCWCRATYSWGGETKKDLGFIEGDLIEALNAGDGLWWMGRLRRDPRAIGLFPSNFVRVLEESFQPVPNSRNGSIIKPAPKPAQNAATRSSAFRKPFQAYEEVGKRSSLESGRGEGTPESDKEKKSRYKPYSSMKTAQAPTGSFRKTNHPLGTATKSNDAPRIPALPSRRGSRMPSPSPLTVETLPSHSGSAHHAPSTYRALSPRPSYRASNSPLPSPYHDGSAFPQLLAASRQPSPDPYAPHEFEHDQPTDYFGYQTSRAPSPSPMEEEDVGSSPPPPPPAHRVAYQPSRAPSPAPHAYDNNDDSQQMMPHTPDPPPHADEGHRMTPSPLRDAMNDVMSSLQDMTVLQRGTPVWSPDEFEVVRSRSVQQTRPQSSLGFGAHGDRHAHGASHDDPRLDSSPTGSSQLEDFVQRMEHQLRQPTSYTSTPSEHPPAPPLKGSQFAPRPTTAGSSSGGTSSDTPSAQPSRQPTVRQRKSAHELGRRALDRTYTTKTNATNSTETSSATQSSASTQLTSRSVMSGHSAGGFSATSAGSLARRKFGLGSLKGQQQRPKSMLELKAMGDANSSARGTVASDAAGSGPSYHESHASAVQLQSASSAGWSGARRDGAGLDETATDSAGWNRPTTDSPGVLGGLDTPKAKKSGFFKKMIESAKTGAATARSRAGSRTGSRPGSRAGSASPTKGDHKMMGIAGGLAVHSPSVTGGPARDMGLGGGDWMQVRRDVNRSNSLSRRERDDRAERCALLGIPAVRPIEDLQELAEGDEGLDGLPVAEPVDFHTPNLALVDKCTRMLPSVPAHLGPAALAQNHVCRPHRSDVQRLRAIFTWVAERVTWEDDFEGGPVDARRVVQTRRGCSEEIAVLVHDMCGAVGLYAEVVRGYLKAPGEVLDLDTLARPNHWWNAVIVDGEWRIVDCALASPTHPRRGHYSSAPSQVAESWYFLARPREICHTHVPLLPEQQHMVPAVPHEALVALPCACPAYFRHRVELADYDTSLLHMETLEMTQLHVHVPEDVECVATVETRALARDGDGDYFESGDTRSTPALAQPEWLAGRKRFTVKALLPGDVGTGVLRVHAGKRGLMHSAKDNPHALALAVPLSHTGANPPYDFVVRHPTPHAQRHDLYITQPQCARLVLNNTFVFGVRQHPSALSRFSPDTWGAPSRAGSPNPSAAARPGSAMGLGRPASAQSMISASVSQSGSNASDGSAAQAAMGMTGAQQKPAKLAIQTPSQKIIRLTRKAEHSSRGGGDEASDAGWTSSWETVIKIGERGVWRGLVLADRSARWCVFAEWRCD